MSHVVSLWLLQYAQAEAKHAADLLAWSQKEMERLRTALLAEQAASAAARLAFDKQQPPARWLVPDGAALSISEGDTYHVRLLPIMHTCSRACL